MSATQAANLKSLRTEVSYRIEPFVPDSPELSLDERCREYLSSLRWPHGVVCPRCSEDSRILWLEARSKWHCSACRYQFSVTAGTLFHHSHLPLWKWLAAVHLTLDSPEGISAAELRRRLGGSYKTFWFAAHRIRAAMRGRGEGLLRALVETESERLAVFESPAGAAWGELSKLRGSERELPVTDEVERLRRSLAGPHHHLSAKHLFAYLDERRWRVAQRGNPNVFRDTIVALLSSERLPYVSLVSGH